MQLTNQQAIEAFRGLTALSNQKVPIKLAWKVSTAILILTPFVTKVNESINEIHQKYASKNADGTFVRGTDEKGETLPESMQISSVNIPLMTAEKIDLLNQTIEVQNVGIKSSDFPDDIEIEPDILTNLSSILISSPINLD